MTLIWEDQMLLCLNLYLCRIFYVVLLLWHNFREFTVLPLVPEALLSSLGYPHTVGSRQGETTMYSEKQLHNQLTASTLSSAEQILPPLHVLFTAIPCTYLPSQAVLSSETSSVIKPRLHFRSICKKKTSNLLHLLPLFSFRDSILQQLFSDERFSHSHRRQIDSWTPAMAMTSRGCILHYSAGNFQDSRQFWCRKRECLWAQKIKLHICIEFGSSTLIIDWDSQVI